VLVTAVTVLCLLSMGGAMLYAWPVLVPLHWLLARRSGPMGTAWWSLLAGMSVFEASWMLAWVVSRNAALALTIGVVAAVATMTLFLRRRVALVDA
jgi:hypothetical protein